jgi:hypothetical protein
MAVIDEIGTRSEQAPPDNRPKQLRRGLRVLGAAIIALVSVGALLRVAPPSQVIDSIGDMDGGWLLAVVALELGSCLSYVVVFRRFFPEPPRAVSRQVAWIAMGAGAVLPGGNFSSAATTGWLLRHHGIGARRLIERCGALLCFLTLFGFFINGVAGARGRVLHRVPGDDDSDPRGAWGTRLGARRRARPLRVLSRRVGRGRARLPRDLGLDPRPRWPHRVAPGPDTAPPDGSRPDGVRADWLKRQNPGRSST